MRYDPHLIVSFCFFFFIKFCCHHIIQCFFFSIVDVTVVNKGHVFHAHAYTDCGQCFTKHIITQIFHFALTNCFKYRLKEENKTKQNNMVVIWWIARYQSVFGYGRAIAPQQIHNAQVCTTQMLSSNLEMVYEEKSAAYEILITIILKSCVLTSTLHRKIKRNNTKQQ